MEKKLIYKGTQIFIRHELYGLVHTAGTEEPLPRGVKLSEVQTKAREFGVEITGDEYERFFSGGGDTIRGYKERSLGPVDKDTHDPVGGNSMLIGNIEYTYPVFSFLKVAAFYDVGNVWEKIGDIGSAKDANGKYHQNNIAVGDAVKAIEDIYIWIHKNK